MVVVLKSKWFRIVCWLLAISLSGWTLAHLPLASITQSISTLSWQQWCVWFGINALIICLGNLRWHGFLAMLKVEINFSTLLVIRQAGQAVSFITPGPQFGGEPLQVFWLTRIGVQLEKSILSIGLDRIYELAINFSILLLCLLILLFIPVTPFFDISFTGATFTRAATVLAVLICCVALLILQRKRIFAVINRLCKPLAAHPRLIKIKHSWQLIGDDLRLVLRTRKSVLLNSVIISLAVWVALLGELALLLNYVHVNFDAFAFLLILISMRLALLLPIPGGIGTLEASVLWSFQYLHFSTTAAVALIALMRLRDLIILLAGLYCLRRVGYRPVAIDTKLSRNLCE